MQPENNSFFQMILGKKYEIITIGIFCVLFFWVTFYFFWGKENTKYSATTQSHTATKFPNSQDIYFENIEKNPEYANIWGKENMKISQDGIKVEFPKGSFSPSNGSIRGGWGFIYSPEFLKDTKHAKLSYTLTFADNFDFVKGWKLPGLCGGTCPRGGNEGDGFSTRFMWRRDGDLEVYGYFPDGSGQSIERGMFRFETWKKYHISQEIEINTPGKKDGIIKVYVDDELVYTNTSMLFRTSTDILPNKVLFSTFFWGADKSWATPVDTSIDFSDFSLSWQ